VDLSASNPSLQPLPGEIWAVTDDANFDGETTTRYLLIIREVQDSDPNLVSVMVLSGECEYRSDINILIPPAISGLEIETIAQTWNLGEIALEYLDVRVGNRLSRQIYDLLLSTSHPNLDRQKRADLEKFDRHERAWLIGLQPAKLEVISKLVTNAIDLVGKPIVLSQWFDRIFTARWQDLTTVKLERAVAIRKGTNSIDLAATILQIGAIDDDRIRRQLIDKISRSIRSIDSLPTSLKAEIATVTIEILEQTDDDDLFWSATDCLQTIEPAHPRAAIGRFKSIDSSYGIHLSLRIAHKKDRQIGIFLQVYSQSEREYLPQDLKLIVSDENNSILQEIIAGARDYCLQLKFSGEVGERFNICLESSNIHSIERFII
jgi:hypothetical protein